MTWDVLVGAWWMAGVLLGIAGIALSWKRRPTDIARTLAVLFVLILVWIAVGVLVFQAQPVRRISF